jgi:hypothetical protein
MNLTLRYPINKKSTQVHDMDLLRLHTGMRAKKNFRLARDTTKEFSKQKYTRPGFG